MIGVYRTVASRSDAHLEVNGSRFIGYVSPTETVEKAEAFVAEIEERHPNATHNIPAYRVPVGSASSSVPGEGSVMLREYQSDDGEPSGSSGRPVLSTLVQQDVRNITVVVMRYYGGTNFGIGGPARVYSRAVKETLDTTGVIEEVLYERFTVTIGYSDSGNIHGLLESVGVELEAAYEADVSFEVRVPVEDSPELRDRTRSTTSGRANIE